MSNNEFKEYVSSLNIPADKKRYTLSFFKKQKYFDELQSIVVQDTGKIVTMGYGDFNSKIVFLTQDINTFEIIKPLLLEYMNKFDINIWNVYTTFVDKIDDNYSQKYTLLVNELNAVKPEIIYIFGRDNCIYDKLIKEYVKLNIKQPYKIIFTNIADFGSEDVSVKGNLIDSLKYLINYKEI